MALSPHEQKALDQIALELYAKDRRLASRLARDGWLARRWRQRLAASALFVVGATLLTCGIFVPHNFIAGMFAISILGYVVMFAAGMLWFPRTTSSFSRADQSQNDGFDMDL
jgi:Protein of unknown function (DUF3040)